MAEIKATLTELNATTDYVAELEASSTTAAQVAAATAKVGEINSIAADIDAAVTKSAELDSAANINNAVNSIAPIQNNVDKALAGLRVNKTLHQNQPQDITWPVKSIGKVVANFAGTKWYVPPARANATNDYSGYDAFGELTGIKSRTGQTGMLLVEPIDPLAVCELSDIPNNLLVPNVDGKLGLWVYIEANDPTNRLETMTIVMIASTNPVNPGSDGAFVTTFNRTNIRHGWNFLVVVMRNPDAYRSDLSATEDHPAGVVAFSYGTGQFSDIKNNAITKLTIQINNAENSKIYFDSLWTGFDAKTQVVIGTDGGLGMVDYAFPIFDDYNWKGYTAFPMKIWEAGQDKLISDLNSKTSPDGRAAYDRGWDFTNHTTNHLRMGDITNPSEIAYEALTATAWQYGLGMPRGAEFYVSPQGSHSNLSIKVLRGLGMKLQRHFPHHNNHMTAFGLDNPSAVGSNDISAAGGLALSSTVSGAGQAIYGMQTASKFKRLLDVHIVYGSVFFPFWHDITIVGDSGSGEDLTGSNLQMTESAFRISMEYLREKELDGLVTIESMSSFWYGLNKE